MLGTIFSNNGGRFWAQNGAGSGPRLDQSWTKRPILLQPAHSGPIGPIWPKRSILAETVHSDQPGPFWPDRSIRPILAEMAISGPHGPFWPDRSILAECSPFWSKWAIPTRTVHDPIPHHRRRRLCLLCLRLACRRLLFDIRIFLLLLQLVWLMGFPQSSSASVVSSSI